MPQSAFMALLVLVILSDEFIISLLEHLVCKKNFESDELICETKDI